MHPDGRLVRAGRRSLLKDISSAEDITFVRLRGNIGDHLIWAGARQLLSSLRYREVAAEQLGAVGGELAVMAGSGGWCEPFHGLAPQTLVELERRFERVVVLPSTFDASFDLTSEVLSQSRARVYAREAVSFQAIESMCDAALAPDCAFYFDFRPYRRRGQGSLFAYRTDAESAVEWSARGGIPDSNSDISLSAQSLDEWLWTIGRHDKIWTDRAHVLIAGALLGKKVRYTSTIYHKVPAMARYSLSTYPVEPQIPHPQLPH
jgi:exopolysaccharide biosynthesis predicted pyruvyltransferase EpsI